VGLWLISVFQQQIANKETRVIRIQLEEIKEFFAQSRDQNFCERIKINTSRYVDLFAQIIDEVMPKPSVNFTDENATPMELLMEQRKANI
jgi:DNA replication licensing factor MCM7